MQLSDTLYRDPNHRLQPQAGPRPTQHQAKHQAKATQNQQLSQEYTSTTELILANKKRRKSHAVTCGQLTILGRAAQTTSSYLWPLDTNFCLFSGAVRYQALQQGSTAVPCSWSRRAVHKEGPGTNQGLV